MKVNVIEENKIEVKGWKCETCKNIYASWVKKCPNCESTSEYTIMPYTIPTYPTTTHNPIPPTVWYWTNL